MKGLNLAEPGACDLRAIAAAVSLVKRTLGIRPPSKRLAGVKRNVKVNAPGRECGAGAGFGVGLRGLQPGVSVADYLVAIKGAAAPSSGPLLVCCPCAGFISFLSFWLFCFQNGHSPKSASMIRFSEAALSSCV